MTMTNDKLEASTISMREGLLPEGLLSYIYNYNLRMVFLFGQSHFVETSPAGALPP